MVDEAEGGSWHGVHEAALLLEISVSTLRRRLKLSTVTARREHGRYGAEWQVWVPNDQRQAAPSGGDSRHGERGERGQVSAGHGYEQSQADHTQAESTLELVRLVAKLQEENRNLAGQLGYLQAQVEQFRALQPPVESPTPPYAPESAQEGHQTGSVAGVVSDDLVKPSASPRKSWWRFW